MATLATTTFGAFFAEQRRARVRLSLREFAARHGFDAGNLSKLERGRLSPPQSRELLERYALALDIPKGSDEWYQFFDLASAEHGRIPDDLLSDRDIAAKLPVLFRALREDNGNEEERLQALIEIIRRG